MTSVLKRGAGAVLAAAGALPERGELLEEVALVEAAQQRGYFLPDEEEFIRARYWQYLGLRAALLETLGELAGHAGKRSAEWEGRIPLFITAFAAACVLMRANRFVVDLASERPVLWKKLDEEDPPAGIPRKTFTAMYRSMSHPVTARRFLMAADFYFADAGRIDAWAGDEMLGPVVGLLRAEEVEIERKRELLLKRMVSYRWFSFLRRNRSAWTKVMFGFFEVSGRAVAELRQPGVKAHGAPKRITPALRREVVGCLKPGDVLVTRHDDAMSNLFLPGYWPHAALFLGSSEDARELGAEVPAGEGNWFLEAKKDGVRVRRLEETLQVDAFVALRPPLALEDLAGAMKRALGHAGKPYDFLFDFRTADRLACTEVIYRGFHGVGPVRFHLEEVGGRMCIPAEKFLDQAIDCGFRVIVTGGLRGDRLLSGSDAEVAFHGSRSVNPRGKDERI